MVVFTGGGYFFLKKPPLIAINYQNAICNSSFKRYTICTSVL